MIDEVIMARTVGRRTEWQIRRLPSAEALRRAATHRETAQAPAAVNTTGIAKGVYRFRSLEQASRHAEEALARAIALNVKARKGAWKEREALLRLPEGAAREIDPGWFEQGETIWVADEFVVGLLFNACGETLQSLAGHIVTIDFEGVPVRTLDLAGSLKTKQSPRQKDPLDRSILERVLQDLREEK